VFYQEIWNVFISIPLVLDYKHSYRSWRIGLNQPQLFLRQIWGNPYVWLLLRAPESCQIIPDSSLFPESGSSQDPFARTRATAPGSEFQHQPIPLRGPSEELSPPPQSWPYQITLASLYPASVKQPLCLKPPNYWYLAITHLRQKKKPTMCWNPQTTILTQPSPYFCIWTQAIWTMLFYISVCIYIYTPSNVMIRRYDQRTLTVTLCSILFTRCFRYQQPLAGRLLVAWAPIFPPLHAGPVGDTETHPSSENCWRRDVCQGLLHTYIATGSHELLLCLVCGVF